MDPFISEIRPFTFDFAPRGWAHCDGQLLPIMQNTALFALLRTNYGGDGSRTFALPDLQGGVAIGAGEGPGLTNRPLGGHGGETDVSLTEKEMPSHTHSVRASGEFADTSSPASFARTDGAIYVADSSPLVQLSPFTVAPQGQSEPHNNMQPYCAVSFCIAMEGVFPPRH
jgi:microcystin-dependent protein